MGNEFVVDETRPIPINESIPIEKVSRTVSARHLYNYLGYSGSNYSKWVKKHILRNQFTIEDTDYLPFIADRNNGGNYIPNPVIDPTDKSGGLKKPNYDHASVLNYVG